MEENNNSKHIYKAYIELPVVDVVTETLESKEEAPNQNTSQLIKALVENSFLREIVSRESPTGNIVHGKNIRKLPKRDIRDISSTVISAYCSPQDCLTNVHERKYANQPDKLGKDIIKGIKRWNERTPNAYGIANSLYEKDKSSKEQDRLMGDPVADSLAIVSYKNCSILAVADGVSWGHKSKLSSNCAIYGSLTYICKNITKCSNTRDIFRCILKSFENSQNVIMNQGATMTTLCVGIIVELKERNRYAFCVVNVGDTYAYVYNNSGVKEITQGSHSLDEVRDMRLCGGALGPADGCNPDLGNLTLSYVVLEEGDFVFLCSDGISDNFDPVVAKFQPRFKLDENSPLLNCETNKRPSNIQVCTCKNQYFKKDLPFLYKRHSLINSVSLPEQYHKKTRSRKISPFSDFDAVESADNSSNEEDDDFSTNETTSDYFTETEKSDVENAFTVSFSDGSCVTFSKENVDAKTEYCPMCGIIKKPESTDTKKRFINKLLKRRKNTITRSVSDQSICEAYPPLSKLVQSQSLENINGFTYTDKTFSNSLDSANVTFDYYTSLDKTSTDSYNNLYPNMTRADSKSSLVSKDSLQMKVTLSLTPRERHRGILEQLREVINNTGGVPINGEEIKADDICTRILSFVFTRTAEKRDILEKESKSKIDKLPVRERKKHNEELKKILDGVPGKLDHASIVAYEVGWMAPKLPPSKYSSQTSISPDSSFDMLEDYIPSVISEARKKDLQDFYVRRASAPNNAIVMQQYKDATNRNLASALTR